MMSDGSTFTASASQSHMVVFAPARLQMYMCAINRRERGGADRNSVFIRTSGLMDGDFYSRLWFETLLSLHLAGIRWSINLPASLVPLMPRLPSTQKKKSSEKLQTPSSGFYIIIQTLTLSHTACLHTHTQVTCSLMATVCSHTSLLFFSFPKVFVTGRR